MKTMMLRFAAVLVLTAASTAAWAQGAPPLVGDRPLVQVKPRTAAATRSQPAKPQSAAVKLQACLDIDDGTKERLNCYDAVIAPAPKPKAVKAKTVADCKFAKEEDERLACFNGFVEAMPKLPKT
ncbi:MAG TPA: hypothetical protein VFR21_29090 [Bradyrhizobium sp.]|nr:hypothetical protein [Bradyrhizobium sp.]